MWDFPHVYNKRPNECNVIEGLFMECQNSKIKRILYILLFLCVQEKKTQRKLAYLARCGLSMNKNRLLFGIPNDRNCFIAILTLHLKVDSIRVLNF